MNNRTMLLILGAVAAWAILTKSGTAFPQPSTGTSPGTFPPPPSGPSLVTAGMSYDPLTGGYCYPQFYTGPYIGPYPNC